MEIKIEQLHVLCAENSDQVIAAIQECLNREFACQVLLDIVRTQCEFLQHIKSKTYDAVLSAYTLPDGGAADALHKVLAICPKVPFICISGTIGEDNAVDLIKQGAMDFVLWERIDRLPAVVRQAIKRANEPKSKSAKVSFRSFKVLRESRENYKLILDSTADGVIMVDREGRIQSANDRLALRLGRAKRAIRGMSICELFPKDRYGDLAERRMSEIREVFETGEYKATVDQRDGFWLENLIYPVFKDTKVCAAAIFSKDISDRKKTEEETNRHSAFRHTILRLSQGFINLPFEQMDQAITDALGMVARYCKAERATVFKYEWRKGTAIRVYEWNRDAKTQIRRTIPLSALSDLVEKQRKPHCQRNSLDGKEEYRCRKVDDEADNASVRSYPLIIDGMLVGMLELRAFQKQKDWADAEDAIVKVFCELMSSVFRRKENEAALRESRESFRLILDSTIDSVVMIDREETIITINEQFAQRLGGSKQAFIGTSYHNLFPKERYGNLAELQLQKVREVFETGKFTVFEGVHEGTSMENRCYPVIKNGLVVAVTLFSTDISDRKKAQEESRMRAEFEAKLQVMTQFFTNVSHEFKTPLSIILMQLELMMLYLDDGKMMPELISAATQNAYRLSKLVGNILDATAIEAGFMKARFIYFDIVALIKNVCESVSPYATAKDIDLSFHSTVKTKFMAVDTEKTERAMLNLLSNAIKFTEKGGQIRIKVKSRRAGGVHISVEDTGEGIPKHKQKIIFERFTQVDPSIARQNEGSGLGLALVKSIVGIMGGSVHVKSEVGKGSKFTVTLPDFAIEPQNKDIQIEGYDLNKKAAMELSDLYLRS